MLYEYDNDDDAGCGCILTERRENWSNVSLAASKHCHEDGLDKEH